MKAAIYCRISQDHKDDQLGVGRQEEQCRELCGTLGWDVADVYVDNDVSATSSKPRPAYRAMLEAVKADRVEAIVCWHPDRLYRKVTDLEELIGVCDSRRVQIATVRAGTVDLTTPSGRLVAGLLAQVAKYEGEHKSERWRASWMQRREAGQPAPGGRRLYGYTDDGEVVPHEKEHIRWAMHQLLAGASIRRVCADLNARGSRSVLGNPWLPVSLRGLLRNPRLAGWVTYKGEPVSRSGWEPIITSEEHETLRAFFDARAEGRTASPRVSPLLGLIYCDVCGGRMVTGVRKRYNSKPGDRVYRCPPPDRGGNLCVEILASRTEAVVEGYAKERLSSPGVWDEVSRTTTDGTASRLAYDLTVLQARHRSLNDALVDEEGRSVSEILRAIEKVRTRIGETQERLAALTPTRLPVGATWPTEVDRRRDLIGVVVKRVWISPATNHGGGVFQRDRIRIES